MNTLLQTPKSDLLDAMSTTLAAPRWTVRTTRTVTSRPGPRRTAEAGTPNRKVRTSADRWSRLAAPWVAPVLRGSFLLAVAGGLAWLGFITLQFLLAWQGLVTGLRSALA